MHLKRWLTAIVAIPVLIYIIGPGPRWLLYLLLFAASLAGLIEFYGITAPGLPGFVRWAGCFLTLLLFIVFYTGQVLFALIIISLWAVVPMTYFMLTHPLPSQKRTTDIGKVVLGPVYVGLPLAMLGMIDRLPRGNIWIFFLLVVIFASDTGAFYFGRFFGKHKLYEAMSPKKTWEGAVGGLVCGILAAFLFLIILRLFRIHIKMDIQILILALSLSVTGQIGDLAESMLKRDHGVKDSGKILPGHGGILDRIDGLLFAVPVLCIYVFGSIR